ncbi:uncharacterized protein PAC_01522 [Phialocephala subalpina]|uniref:2EXR domain-containing protein n=1 Tax=Phialocephala subalpina TaxID=576137 RepID=A0A1L7WFU3_9HELO|nr:uncharacterized protein PAC_01522 [Phialocephala subalpina]
MATTIEEPDFKVFPKLPQELQDEVWDATIKEEMGGIKVYIKKKGFWSKKMTLTTTAPTQSLLVTTYASRQRALKRYTGSIESNDGILRFDGDTDVILILDGKYPDKNQPWPVTKNLPGKYTNIKTIGIPASACIWMEDYLRGGFFYKFHNLQRLVIFFCCACCPGSHHKDSEQCAHLDPEEIQLQRAPHFQFVLDRLAEHQQHFDPSLNLQVSTASFELPQKHRLCLMETSSLDSMVGNMVPGCVVM